MFLMPAKKYSLTLLAVLTLAGANGFAMSLGKHRSAAVIGRPLDISVFAVMDAQDDVASLCLDADVFYADNRLDKSRVRVTAEKVSGSSQDVVIRVRSSSLIDEPVVSLYLRVGCQQKIERRYVTLADLAPETSPERSFAGGSPIGASSAIAPALAAPLKASSTNEISTAVGPLAVKPAKKIRRSAAPQSSAVAKPDANAAVTATAIAASSQLAVAPKPSNRPRLKLESPDLSIDRDPQLRVSSELLSVPSTNPQERSAAAAMWRAIAAQPQDILRDTAKLQALESSVRNLQTQGKQTQQSIDELGAKLQAAQSQRFANPLVYLLAVFLLLALAGLAYLLKRQSLFGHVAGQDTPWWRKNERQSESKNGLSNAWGYGSPSGESFEAHDDIHSKKPKSNSSSTAADINMEAAEKNADSAQPHSPLSGFSRSDLAASKSTSNFGADSAFSIEPQYRNEFALSVPYASRAVKAEELFDVQQQADFFVSIGQKEQAIEVLRDHIGDDVETSALVYLDLFKLYHQLGRQDDYAALRADFNQLFNTKVPAFDAYAEEDSGLGLEAYQAATSRIQALWPSPKVLEIIEESIFRRPENNAEAFNLKAYRELLLLYAVAKEIISPEHKSTANPAAPLGKLDQNRTPADSGHSQPTRFQSTSIQPLSASVDENRASLHPDALMEPLLLSTIPPASSRLGLDVDLSEPLLAPHNLQPALKKTFQAPKNLIDFDAFDIVPDAVEKPKPRNT